MICPICQKVYTPVLQRIPGDNRLIQEVFPNATEIEREQLLSGICSDKCWDSMFKEDN
jgi:hypothetical protein